MDLLQEIRNDFSGIEEGRIIPITSLGKNDDVIITKSKEEGYVIGICVDDSVPSIDESFTTCHLFTSYLVMNNTRKRCLFLSCNSESFKREFASLCCDFVEPGSNYIYRIELLKNPLVWWKKWINLLGNTVSEKNVYCVIAEMLALDTIFQEDKSAVWLAAKAGVRDIETNTGTYEVKSTIRRTGYDVTINSVYQLDNNKDFWLLFLRMEESKDDGVSINDMCRLLLSHGYDREKLDNELKKQGINRDNHICNIKYRVIERVKYLVDNEFPKIVDSSFIDGHRPKGIDKITYSVDLSVVKGCSW